MEMSLNEFLVWLSGIGGVIAASWLLEQFGWFQGLVADTKRLVFFAACLVISLGAYATVTFVPAETLQMLAPWFAIVSATFVSVFVGESYHAKSKE